MKPQLLNMESDALAAFRFGMDAALSNVMAEMKKKNLMKGTVTGKIDIVMVDVADNDTGEVQTKIEIDPVVNMKVGSKGKYPCGLVTGLVMAMDEDGNPIVASSQIDIDELLAEKEGERNNEPDHPQTDCG